MTKIIESSGGTPTPAYELRFSLMLIAGAIGSLVLGPIMFSGTWTSWAGSVGISAGLILLAASVKMQSIRFIAVVAACAALLAGFSLFSFDLFSRLGFGSTSGPLSTAMFLAFETWIAFWYLRARRRSP